MDIFSHGLWGSLAFGRKSKRSFFTALFFGMAPDLFSFGIFFLAVLLGFSSRPDFSEPPDARLIPAYVGHLYNFTHSFIVFMILFWLLWAIFRRPVWEFSAWGLHILFDIPTHSHRFFPTPFLWPLSHFEVNGIPWASPQIFIPNVVLLVAFYLWFFVSRRRSRMAQRH